MNSPMVVKLAHIADREAMWAEDLARFPELLRGTGIDPEDITPIMARKANRYNRDALEALIQRYGANQPIVPKDVAKEIATRVATASSGRAKLWGHPITAIIRWMGADGWTFKEAVRALRSLEVDVTDATIRAQLNAGKKGTRGEPAPLTKPQALQLHLAAEEKDGA